MNARSRRTAVSLGLLFGVVYGLGAAPCGCWEHSGWRVAVALVSEEPTHPPADTDRLVADDCHGHASSSAVVADRLRFDPPADGLQASGFASSHFQGGWGSVGWPAEGHDAALIAPPVRAELQVFRL